MAKILIIEDGAAIAAIEKDYLELSGYEVNVCADGVSGLTAALEQPFDPLLLDLMLPGMDGFAVCRRVREVKDIPILMVTALGKDVDKIRGLGYGADDYIEKPFLPSVLVARVKTHLAQYRRLKPSAAGAAVLTKTDRRFGWMAIPVAAVIAFSRLYLFVHYPSDILAGALLGMAIGLAAYRIGMRRR